MFLTQKKKWLEKCDFITCTSLYFVFLQNKSYNKRQLGSLKHSTNLNSSCFSLNENTSDFIFHLEKLRLAIK